MLWLVYFPCSFNLDSFSKAFPHGLPLQGFFPTKISWGFFKIKLCCKLWIESIWWKYSLTRNLCEETKSELKLHSPTTSAFPQSPSRVTTCPCLCSTGPKLWPCISCFSDSSPDSQSSAMVEHQQSSTADLVRFMLLGNFFPEKASVGGNCWLLGLFSHSRRKLKIIWVLRRKLLVWECWDKSNKMCTSCVDVLKYQPKKKKKTELWEEKPRRVHTEHKEPTGRLTNLKSDQHNRQRGHH